MIFGSIPRDFCRNFKEVWRNWFVVRSSINQVATKEIATKKIRFRGHCGLQTASEVRSDLKFEIDD